MKTHDVLERLLPNQRIDDGLSLRPVECDYMWWNKIDLHGDLPTKYLIEYATLLGHRKKTSRSEERLGFLYRRSNTPHGGRYLDRHKDQFKFPKATYIPRNLYVAHRLGEAAKLALKERGEYIGLSHKGWFKHQVMLACVTASIELACIKAGYRFIPRHEIYPHRLIEGVPYEYEAIRINPATHKHEPVTVKGAAGLEPDGLCAIDYGSTIRYVFVEVDRANETNSSEKDDQDQKTHAQSFSQYQHLIRRGLYKTKFGIKDEKFSTGVLLFATTAPRAMNALKNLVARQSERGRNTYICFYTLPMFGDYFSAPGPLYQLWGEWERAGMDPLDISKPPAAAA